MKKSKFSDSQIIEALKRVEGGLSVPELCRELAISSATFYKRRDGHVNDGPDEGAGSGECAAEEDVCRGALEG